SQAKGDVASQRNGAALSVHTTILLLKPPVGIKPPKESVTCIGWEHALVWATRILDLRDTGCIRATEPAGLIQRTIMHCVIGIENHRNDSFLEQPQINLEVAVLTS